MKRGPLDHREEAAPGTGLKTEMIWVGGVRHRTPGAVTEVMTRKLALLGSVESLLVVVVIDGH